MTMRGSPFFDHIFHVFLFFYWTIYFKIFLVECILNSCDSSYISGLVYFLHKRGFSWQEGVGETGEEWRKGGSRVIGIMDEWCLWSHNRSHINDKERKRNYSKMRMLFSKLLPFFLTFELDPTHTGCSQGFGSRSGSGFQISLDPDPVNIRPDRKPWL